MILANKYEILEKLGDGRFGIVYRGVHVKTDVLVAIKIETSTTLCLLKHETTLLKYLADQGVRRYIPQVHWFGIIHGHAFLVIPFYEPLTNTSVNADKWMRQAVDILESIHSKHVVHRDIKPENFMQKDDHLVLIDFGLATIADGSDDNASRGIVGTPKYASYYTHIGFSGGKRDDLLSLCYVGLEWMGRVLPWDNGGGSPKTELEYTRLKSWIHVVSTDCLPAGKVHTFWQACYSLTRSQVPEYAEYKKWWADTL